MKRVAVFVWLAVAALPAVCSSALLLGVTDHFDSYQSVQLAQLDPRVVEAARELGVFVAASIPGHLAEVERVLGQSKGYSPDSTYALPLCQSRWVGIGGLHSKGQRLHAEFYPVEAVGGLQVYYDWDWTTVAEVVVYVKADSTFVPCNLDSQNNLSRRITWDQNHLAAMEAAIRLKVGR